MRGSNIVDPKKPAMFSYISMGSSSHSFLRAERSSGLNSDLVRSFALPIRRVFAGLEEGKRTVSMAACSKGAAPVHSCPTK